MIEKFGISHKPWVLMLSQYDNGCNVYKLWEITSEEDPVIAAIDYEVEIKEPDARLIASAPDMLEALINMCLDMEQYGNAWGSAERLIEKATGKTWEEAKTILESEK